jgi:hypothetical protein
LQIKAIKSFATKGSGYRVGETYQVAAATGKQWVKNGWAVEVKTPRAKKSKNPEVI